MRRALVLALAAALTLAGCAAPAADDRPLVVVTTNILGDVVSELVGDEAEVLTLMPPNADPHSFEISAQEAARIEDAVLTVANGLGLEEGLAQHIERGPVVEAGAFIDPIDYADGGDGGVDPHLWTDPQRMREVAAGIAAELQAVLPASAAVIAANAAAYDAELAELDTELAATFAVIPEQRRALVTNHHVFGYLADRYGFEVVGAIVPGGSTLAAPSAADLDELATAIRSAGVPAIFADSSQPDRLAQALAEEAGVDVAVVALFTESLSEPGSGADTYLRMMRANAGRITAALAGPTDR
ncbi:zinc ABC transporter substrate-binding protein [Microbacteriaceae bacterium VKM Ac-2854]|nr:zinc ABC transporter substrate-binding protein [Microbacteriaceae bacterium VKM Ac-2854]